MKTKILAALSLAVLLNSNVNAELPAIAEDNAQENCEVGYIPGFYVALGLDFILGSVKQQYESENAIAPKWLTTADGIEGTGARPTTAGGIGVYQTGMPAKSKLYNSSKSAFQFGGSLELGYEHLVTPTFLIGIYASAGFASVKKDVAFDGDCKAKVDKEKGPAEPEEAQLLANTTAEATSFSLRAGITLGYVFQAQTMAMYIKLGILKHDYKVNQNKHRFEATLRGTTNDKDQATIIRPANEVKYTSIRPEIGIGLKKQFQNGCSLGFEALYAIPTSSKNKFENKAYENGIPLAAYATCGTTPASDPTIKTPEANIKEAQTKIGAKAAKLDYKVSASVVTFRIYAAYNFKAM